MDPARTLIPGLYGKLPAHGDFVARGHSHALCEALDRLLQPALASGCGAGRPADGGAGLPVHALGLRAGALAPGGYCGCIVPSVDKVGRFFPLCVGVETPPGWALNWLPAALALQLARQVRQAQAQRLDADTLQAQLLPAAHWPAALAQALPFAAAHDITVPALPADLTRLLLAAPEAALPPSACALGSQLPQQALALGARLGADGYDLFFADRQLADLSAYGAWFDQRWDTRGWRPVATGAAN